MINPKNDGWPDSRDDLLDVAANTTPLQRLEWLEDMLDLALQTGALANARELEDEAQNGDAGQSGNAAN